MGRYTRPSSPALERACSGASHLEARSRWQGAATKDVPAAGSGCQGRGTLTENHPAQLVAEPLHFFRIRSAPIAVDQIKQLLLLSLLRLDSAFDQFQPPPQYRQANSRFDAPVFAQPACLHFAAQWCGPPRRVLHGWRIDPKQLTCISPKKTSHKTRDSV
jgi:hypothetical protein